MAADEEGRWALTRDEAVALAAGVTVTVASLVGLGLVWVLDPTVGRGLVLQGVAHVAVGRESGLPVGLAYGVPPWLAGLAAFAQNAVVLFVGYGAVGLAARGALGRTRLGHWIRGRAAGVGAAARRSETPGVLALAGSLWVPLLPTGALAAALAGRAAGYRPARLLPAVVVSALAADVAYAYALAGAAGVAGGATALWLLAGAAAMAGTLAALVRRHRAKRKEVSL